MSRFSQWSLGAKLMTFAAVGLLLTFGLCSVGTPFMGQGTPAQDFATQAGLLTFALSVILLVVGIVSLIVRSMKK